ncbi:esterase/lipase family protein [Flocculibacter collagenilyticus]|uniref:esterase/lipase family protein n=1 Tax=Flocculibacter collagenilyticus TaxID=2744479 RepID=UPI0018F4E520|nr:alpha/beta fold hydrolase [Flocculibacter collagenilyticus]
MQVLLIFLFLVCLAYGCAIAFAYIKIKNIYAAKNIPFSSLSKSQLFAFAIQIIKGLASLVWWALSKNKYTHQPLANSCLIVKNARQLKAPPVILCIHGFHADGTCFWGMRKFLEENDCTTYAVDMGLPYVNLDNYIQRLSAQIDNILRAHPEQKLNIVAHSMGGLMTRLLLKHKPDYANHIDSIITLGSPHSGTQLVNNYFLTWMKSLFHVDSPFLKALPTLHELAPHTNVTTLASQHDLIVYPYPNAHLPNASNITVESLSHIGMLTEPHIHQFILDTLRARKINQLISSPKEGQYAIK